MAIRKGFIAFLLFFIILVVTSVLVLIFLRKKIFIRDISNYGTFTTIVQSKCIDGINFLIQQCVPNNGVGCLDSFGNQTFDIIAKRQACFVTNIENNLTLKEIETEYDYRDNNKKITTLKKMTVSYDEDNDNVDDINEDILSNFYEVVKDDKKLSLKWQDDKNLYGKFNKECYLNENKKDKKIIVFPLIDGSLKAVTPNGYWGYLEEKNEKIYFSSKKDLNVISKMEKDFKLINEFEEENINVILNQRI